MRTTVKLTDDVAAAVRRMQREEGIGLSEAINRLARGGLSRPSGAKRFEQRSVKMGPFLVDVSNIAEALDVVEGPNRR
jgi:hypothetical protein